MIECGAGGACSYNSVGLAFALRRDKVKLVDARKGRDKVKLVDARKTVNSRGKTLRAELASYTLANERKFLPFWLPPEIPDNITQEERQRLLTMEDGDIPTTWAQCKEALGRPKRWADEVAFRASCKRMNCRIVVVIGKPDIATQFLVYGKKVPYDSYTGKHQVNLLLYFDGGHYQLIVPKQGQEIPESWNQLEQGNNCFPAPRGGGGSSTASWMPPVPPSSTASAAQSIGKAWLYLPSVPASSTCASQRSVRSRCTSQGGRKRDSSWLPPAPAPSASGSQISSRACKLPKADHPVTCVPCSGEPPGKALPLAMLKDTSVDEEVLRQARLRRREARSNTNEEMIAKLRRLGATSEDCRGMGPKIRVQGELWRPNASKKPGALAIHLRAFLRCFEFLRGRKATGHKIKPVSKRNSPASS